MKMCKNHPDIEVYCKRDGLCRKCYHKSYHLEHRESRLIYNRSHSRIPENLEKAKDRKRREDCEVHGITLEEREILWKYGCEICGSFKKLVVDHDHKTDKIRGCLCAGCNMLVGRLGDSAGAEKLKKVIRYLLKDSVFS